jgi:predicted enzyme related to lactoylglutathione lyase
MVDPKTAPAHQFSFTKALVADLEKIAIFYKAVFDMKEVMRVQDKIAGKRIDEIILSLSGEMETPSLILLKFVDQAPPAASDSILGFTTADLDAVLQRVRKAGGAVVQESKTMPEMGLKVGFATDPEGRLLEIVQML